MSRGVFQPVGQKRLTNIAVVRLKKNGQRFEIACYKNKVGDWRMGIEKDLDEVLQSTTVFSNVGKGVLAKDKDLQAAFGKTDHEAICLEILAKGELQVSDKERKSDFDNLFKDVATLLSEKCVNPDTNRPYTITMLERALRDIHFNIDPKKNAKQHMLEAIPQLKEQFPIERARMQLNLQVPAAASEQLHDWLAMHQAIIKSADTSPAGIFIVTAQVDPGLFRELHQLVAQLGGPKGRVDVMTLAVMNEGGATDDFSQLPSASAGPSAAVMPLAVAQPFLPAVAAAPAPARAGVPSTSAAAAPAITRTGRAAPDARGGTVVYQRGPISDLPEEHASRRERFAELDTLQPGWQVELVSRGAAVDAQFYSPAGELVGAYANARRLALKASKEGVTN